MPRKRIFKPRDVYPKIEQTIVRIGGVLLLVFHLVGILRTELDHLFRIKGILL